MLDTSATVHPDLAATAQVPSLRHGDVTARRVWPYLAFAVVLLVGVYFRFTNLGTKVYWNDEVVTSHWFAGETMEDVREILGDRVVGVSDVMQYQRNNPDRGFTHFLAIKAITDPQHPPLHYIMAWLWARCFGDSIATVRCLSAFISLMAFPCLFWLCGELFGTSMTGWIGMALLAVSPFHVLYAQEARDYSLLTVFVLTSCALLIRAMRQQTVSSWGLYTLSMIFGLYSSLMFTVVALAHGIYVLGMSFDLVHWRPLRLPRSIWAFAVAMLISLAAFGPWIVAMVNSMAHARSQLEWLQEETSLRALVGGWFFCLGTNFIDLMPDRDDRLNILLRLPAVLMAICSVAYVCRYTERKAWLMLVALIVANSMATVAPDLATGGQRSCVPRFLLPGLLAILIATAHSLATFLMSRVRVQRLAALFVLAATIGVAITSNVVAANEVRWWNKGRNNKLPIIANVINEAKEPFVVSATGPEHLGNAIALCHRLNPQARLVLMNRSDEPQIPDGLSDVFLFKPSPALQRKFEARGFRVELTTAPGLCRLVR